MIDSNYLYEQIYYFFKKENATKLIYYYMRRGMNLIFNSDSLIITTKYSLYKVTVIKIHKKNYWNIKSNNSNNRVICKDGNLDELFEYIYNNDYK